MLKKRRLRHKLRPQSLPDGLRGDMRRGDLVAWLNGQEGSAAYERVCEILRLSEQLIELDTERNYPAASLLGRHKVTSTPEQIRNIKERRGVAARLNHVLRRYTTFPSANFSADRLQFRWEPVKGSDRYTVKREVGTERYYITEADAVRVLLEWEASGRRHPVFQCDQCGTWTYRRVRQRRFCSESCRQAEHAQSPGFKEKRRRYMRKYRKQWL